MCHGREEEWNNHVTRKGVNKFANVERDGL